MVQAAGGCQLRQAQQPQQRPQQPPAAAHQVAQNSTTVGPALLGTATGPPLMNVSPAACMGKADRQQDGAHKVQQRGGVSAPAAASRSVACVGTGLLSGTCSCSSAPTQNKRTDCWTGLADERPGGDAAASVVSQKLSNTVAVELGRTVKGFRQQQIKPGATLGRRAALPAGATARLAPSSTNLLSAC